MQVRKREDALKRNLSANFPKILACLKIQLEDLRDVGSFSGVNLNDFDVFWNGLAGEPQSARVNIEQILGRDYRAEIDKVLAAQDIKFRGRYEQYLDKYRRESAQLRTTSLLQVKTAQEVAAELEKERSMKIQQLDSLEKRHPGSAGSTFGKTANTPGVTRPKTQQTSKLSARSQKIDVQSSQSAVRQGVRTPAAMKSSQVEMDKWTSRIPRVAK